MVSPTRVSATCLIAAVKKPISPGRASHFLLRAEDADPVDQIGGPVDISLIRWPFLSSPSMIRTSTTTPR